MKLTGTGIHAKRKPENKKLLRLCAQTRILELTDKYYDLMSDPNASSRQLQAVEENLYSFRELSDMLGEKGLSEKKLSAVLEDPGQPKAFRNFSADMRSSSALSISKRYREKALRVAEKNDLLKPDLGIKIADTFDVNGVVIGLKRQQEKNQSRRFKSVRNLVLGAALSAAIIGGIHGITTDKTQGADTQITSEQTVESDEEQQETSEQTLESESDFTPPISEVGTLSSYEETCDAFYKMLSEIYEYNTGESIDLSDLGQSDMAYNSSGTEYVVNYNGQTYYFSGNSSYRTNQENLRKALEAAGATYETTTARIYSIARDGTSLAITDGTNALRSGIIMEDASGGGEMYNQSYVNAGRKMLESQGIDTSGMSEAELVGRYILSDEYAKQNDELSKALADMTGPMNTIKTTFYIKESKYGDKEDSNAIRIVKDELNDIANLKNLEAESIYNRENGIDEYTSLNDLTDTTYKTTASSKGSSITEDQTQDGEER